MQSPRIKWQYSGIAETAKVILAINPNGFRNTESLESYIVNLSTNYATECVANGEHPSMTGTGGWYVTFIQAEDEEYDYVVEVTVMSYVIKRYLEETGVL